MGLFDSPVLQIQQLSSQLEYEISDENGRPLGSAAQVAGRKPNKGLRAMVSGSGLEGARVIVQVRDPDVRGQPAYGQNGCGKQDSGFQLRNLETIAKGGGNGG